MNVADTAQQGSKARSMIRSSSNDSRNWGTVHRRYIYGKAVFVYWPLDKMGPLR